MFQPRIIVAFVALLTASTAVAQTREKLAVLDLWYDEGTVTDSASQVLTDMLRSAATEASAGRFDVLRRETMVALLPPEQLRCAAGSCMATIGQTLQAQYVTGGHIRKVGSQLTLTVELYETVRKSALGSKVLLGKSVEDLLGQLHRDGRTMLEAWLPKSTASQPTLSGSLPPPSVDHSGPVVRSESVKEAVGELIVEVKSANQVRLELTDPNRKSAVSGSPYKNSKAKPGQWKLVAQAAGHETETRDFFVPADEITLVKFDLKPLGGLSITGEPQGAAVTVTGPGGFKHDGALPWQAEGLRSGSYRVKVSRATYDPHEEDVEVEPGRTARVAVKLSRAGQGGGAGMIRIPGGTFDMGSNDGDSDEKPVTRVTLSPYFIDRTEVTVGEYRKCVQTGKCSAPDTGDWCNWAESNRENHPINCVDWSQATQFCAWRGARLPTEAEWEFAAKGTDGRKYPWGNQAPGRQACWEGEGNDLGKGNRKSTCEVGSYQAGASPFGVQDMAGNVWEWVSDWYGNYPGGSVRDPKGSSNGSSRVLRGGGWVNGNADGLRAADRLWNAPTIRGHYVGFRCARGAVR